MKSVRYLLYIVLFAVSAIIPLSGKAQISLDSYYNVDWQFNTPLSNK